MCGIAGLVPRGPETRDRLERTVRRMAAALVHRGPDDEGFHVASDVALGFRRLAIVDRAGSRQPMTSPDGRLTLVLDFGPVFDGTPRFLELRVRPGADAGAFVPLTPRQSLRPTPEALRAFAADNAGEADAAPWSGLSGVPANAGVFRSNMDILALSLDVHFNALFPNMGKKRREKQQQKQAGAEPSSATPTP